MNAFRPRKIHIGDYILCNLLLERGVRRVDARIRIGLAEYRHAGSHWKGLRRNRRWHQHARVRRKIAARRVEKPARNWPGRDRLLLDAVRRDRTDLRQHILARIVDAPTCTPNRLAVS